MRAPRVTVIMAVYNGERFLRQAIHSILNQTFTNFELLIVDDASKDSTNKIIRLFMDPRIYLIRNELNCGAGYSRNVGLQNARGEYIAVLDADDVALPERLAVQVAFLDAHPEIVLFGSSHELIDEQGNFLKIEMRPTEPIIIQWKLLFGNCITNSTVMFRRQEALDVGGYDERLPTGEDFSLWGRLAAFYTLAQTSKVLVRYRSNPIGLAQTHSRSRILKRNTLQVIRQNIQRFLQENISLEIASCLYGAGEYMEKTIINMAYITLWKCLIKTIAQAKTRKDSQCLFKTMLTDLLRLARQSEPQRFKALVMAMRLGMCYIPEYFFYPHFFKFALSVVLPRRFRKMF